jgi:hypothetical protein
MLDAFGETIGVGQARLKARPRRLRALRRLIDRTFAGIAVASLAWGLCFAQDAGNSQKKPSDEPPPVDQLLPKRQPAAVAGQSDTTPGWGQYRVWCRDGDASCNNGLGGNWIYRAIRHCWRPHIPVKITTSMWFGEAARAPRQSAPSTILIRFDLNQNGTLAAPPRSVTPNPSAAARAEIDGLIAAINHCQPYGLPPGANFEQWKNILMGIVIEKEK